MPLHTRITMREEMHESILQHLLQSGSECEEAAFVFAHTERGDGSLTFNAIDQVLLGEEWFVARSPCYLELTDACRAMVIKRAHDLKASLIEFHSHPAATTASFSWSDLGGFEQFVPHVWLRLQCRPYAAVVVAGRTFDGVVWADGPTLRSELDALRAGDRTLTPTNITISNWECIRGSRAF